jgi:ribose transport system ATP-binding protein
MVLAEPGAPHLRLEAITKRFGATAALEGVDLEARAGEIHALVGENGAGKSTLLRILAGELAPDAGRIELAGRAFAPRSSAEARAAGVALIHQELCLAPHLSVEANLVLGVEPRRGPFLDRAALRARARAALHELGAEHLPLERPVRELASAERQQVEIARALALDARVLVLDEPTSSLARAECERLFALLQRLRARGRAIVYVSHALEEVERLADRVTVLRDGRRVLTAPAGELDAARLVSAMVGREVGDLYPRSPRRPGEVLLSLAALSGAALPVEASLELRRGEVLGIAGLVGAGRTECLRAIFGLDPVRRGELRVAGTLGPACPDQRWRAGVGFVSEDRAREGLALGLSVAENLCLADLRRSARAGVLAPGALGRAARPWIERLGIRAPGPAAPVARLSGGNQQKVALARLLHAEVDLFLLDEPTRGIDVGAKAALYRRIDELAVAGKAVLFVSSYLPELLGIADRIAVMRAGRLGAARPASECSEESILREATGAGARDARRGA